MVSGDRHKLLDCAALIDCGCQVLVWKDGSGAEVEYCPMHAAAPDLVEALKNLVDWYDYDPNCIDNCPACIAYADAKEILDQVDETNKG